MSIRESEERKRVTRSMIKQQQKKEIFSKIESKDERDFLEHLHNDFEASDIISGESFYGVYNFLARSDAARMKHPIIIIIKNIKAFP